MTPKHLYLLLLSLITINNIAAQNEDDLQIPVENDNQFPPDRHSDSIDGSGDGAIEEPEEIDAATTIKPLLENVQPRQFLHEITTSVSEDDYLCPKPCVCRLEGNDFVVDCSGYDLTDFPILISKKATILNLQNNKLTEIPKEISSLKNLRILNANDNLIKKLAPGSVSELPALVTLKLKNNRLIEYPNDLKNSFGLIKLEELDLSGNDMRTTLTSELFSQFEALRTITLPSSTPALQQDLCDALPNNLENVCTESCESQLFECGERGEDGDIPVLPGMLPPAFEDEDFDPVINTPKQNSETDATNQPTETNTKTVSAIPASNSAPEEFSFRSAVINQPSDVGQRSSIVESPNDVTITPDPPVKVGATTSDTKTGGVDKSIIGLVVAGMVVIVAAITIKKNWSSIKKRFSSNNRTPNERNGTNANGTSTTPEEVPLQDKSPV